MGQGDKRQVVVAQRYQDLDEDPEVRGASGYYRVIKVHTKEKIHLVVKKSSYGSPPNCYRKHHVATFIQFIFFM